MMGLLSWFTGIGLPSLAGAGCLVGAAAVWFKIPVIGRYIGLVLAMIGVALIANARGFSNARALCNEASVRAELEQTKRDLTITIQAADKASELTNKLTEAERRNDDLARKLTGSCLLDERDADGLRRIR